MLKKLAEMEIKPESPFENDALGRESSIELLTKLIQSTQQPFVLSLEAPWGFGKTTFIRLWKSHLENQKHICLYFNAWENDFVDDPLVAFIGEMSKSIGEGIEKSNQNEPLKADWEKLKRLGVGVLRKSLPLAIQIATHGLLHRKDVKDGIEALGADPNKLEEFAAELAKERLHKYEVERNGIKAFRESLEGVASEVTKDGNKKAPLVFFVDELDRCRPDFAIALLERIKHLFNVKNVVFVLAIDRTQLDQSVKALYGTDAQPDGYLRRFIDLSYRMPMPKNDTFALRLFHRFSFSEVGSWYGKDQAFIGSFTRLAATFKLSLRTQEQCFTEINVALRNNGSIQDFPYILSFLSTLRAFRPSFADELRENRLEVRTVLEWISENNGEALKLHAEASLLVGFPENNDASKRIKEVNRLVTPNLVPSGEESAIRRARELHSLMVDLKDWRPNVTQCILSLLTLSSGFR